MVAAAAGIVTVGGVASPDAGLSLMVIAVAAASRSRFTIKRAHSEVTLPHEHISVLRAGWVLAWATPN